MMKLPRSAQSFLARHWQKSPLFMPQALDRLRPSVSRNELAWLATLDDVESRLVFTQTSAAATRYSAESGPFDSDYNAAGRCWFTLSRSTCPSCAGCSTLFPSYLTGA